MAAALGVIKNLFVTFVSIGNILVNPVILLAIARCATQRKEILTPLTISVFVGDLIHGVFVGPVSCYLSWMEIHDPPKWLVCIQSYYVAGVVSSFCSATLLSLFQTIAITKPLTFPVTVTKKRILSGLTVTWILAIIFPTLRVSFPGFFYDAQTRFVIGLVLKLNNNQSFCA